jgi:hypothetical protein
MTAVPRRKTNQGIGAQLCVGARTIEWNRRDIFLKLGITSRSGQDTAALQSHRPADVESCVATVGTWNDDSARRMISVTVSMGIAVESISRW